MMKLLPSPYLGYSIANSDHWSQHDLQSKNIKVSIFDFINYFKVNMGESRKEREFKLRELEILSTAIALFSEHGLDNVTVADIAKATDIGKGTIYKHFVSKDVILVKIANDFSRDQLEKINTINIADSCQAQMRKMFEICFKAHAELPLMNEICHLCQQASFINRLSEESRQEYMAIEQEYFVILNRICEKGIHDNDLPNLPVEELIIGAYATFMGALDMLQSQHRHCFTDTPQLSQQRFIDIIINYTMTGLFGCSDKDQQPVLGESHE